MNKAPSIFRRYFMRICAIPFAALFAAPASAASFSWTSATDAVWSTGADWTNVVAQTDTEATVYDASGVADLNHAINSEATIPAAKVTTLPGLITIGGINALTLSAGEMNLNGALPDLELRALVALAAEQSRKDETGRTLIAKDMILGAKVNLNKIDFGEPALSSPNISFATTTNGDEALNVKGSLKGTTGIKLSFTNCGTLSIGTATRTIPKLESVKFNDHSAVVRPVRNGGKSTVQIAKRNTGANEKVLTSGEPPSDLTASLKLQHVNGIMPAFEEATPIGADAVRDLNLRATNILTAQNLNLGRQYQLTRLTPQASPPASGLLSISFTFGYGSLMENANGSGPGAISNFWNHVDAYPMSNNSLATIYNDIPAPPAPALHSNSYWLNGANRGLNTFRNQNGHMVKKIGSDINNQSTLVSDGSTLATAMTFTYDDPATIGAFAHNGSYGSGPVIEPGLGTQPYNQRQLRWTASGDSGGSISYFEFGNIPVDRLGGLYSVYLQGSGFIVPQLTNLTSPTLRLQTPGKAGTLILSYIQFVAVPTTIYWTGASTPPDALWSNSSNLSTDSSGLVAMTVPLANFHSVVFNATNAVNFQNTTLGSDQTIQTLKFGSNATIPVSIGGNNTLTIVPTLPTTGVTVETLSGNHTISSKVALGAAQTWTVTDANQILTMSGVISGDFALNKTGAGTLLLTGQNTSTGAITASAGTLQLGDGGSAGSISKDSTLTVNGTLAINRTNNTIQGVDFGPITGSGGLSQNGNGTTTLSLVNSYTGGTNVNAGTLLLTGTITGTATVNNGGTLAGDNGTLGNVVVNSGGTFSPGSGAIGSLTVNGSLNLNTSSILSIQFDSTAPATDQIFGVVNLNITTGATLNISDIGSNPEFVYDIPASIITYSGSWNGGTFAGLPDDTYFTSGGRNFLISYNGADSDVPEGVLTLTMVQNVPEPGAAVSLLGGLGILLGVRRRRV